MHKKYTVIFPRGKTKFYMGTNPAIFVEKLFNHQSTDKSIKT
jgi:hypothetical protein